MGQAGSSDRALQVGLLSRVTAAATLTGAVVVSGAVVGEHLSGWAPAGLFLLLLTVLGGVVCASGVWGASELVEVGVCAVFPIRPGRARLKTVPRGRARLVPTATLTGQVRAPDR